MNYSQKLAFSDDESTPEEEVRKDTRSQSHSNKDEKRSTDRERESSERERERDRDNRRVSCAEVLCIIVASILHAERKQ